MYLACLLEYECVVSEQVRINGINMIKTSVHNLVIGMHVAKLDQPWLSTSFFRHSFLISDQKQLDRLKAECEFVYIDPEKSVVEAGVEQKATTTADSIKIAAKEIDNIKKSLVAVFGQIQKGSHLNTKLLIPTIGSLTNKILNETDTYLYIAKLKEKDNTLAEKSIKVFILFLAFAKHIGIKKDQLVDIGLAAILHDIGMLTVPKSVLNSAFLNKEERQYIENHTKVGVDILSQESDFSELTLKIISHHHENINGSGYPKGLKGRDISVYGRMLNITCMYEALTRDRAYKKAVSPIEAVTCLIRNIDTKIDSRLTLKFIEALGVYPPGSVISLNNGNRVQVKSVDAKRGYKVVPFEPVDKNEHDYTPVMIQLSDIKQLIYVNDNDVKQ